MLPLGLMAPPPGEGERSIWIQIAPLIIIFGIFYFILIRPARRRQKQVQQMLNALKPGDKVVTSGGLIGTVSALDRDIVQLRIADKVKIDVTKSSVVGLHDQNASPTPDA